MPRGPKGEKCLADVVGNAAPVLNIGVANSKINPHRLRLVD